MEQALEAKFKNVISKLDSKFSSHDFIKRFLAMFENEYRLWFNESTVHAIHAKIGKLLVDNQEVLGIERNGRTDSETFHGTIGNVQSWKNVQKNGAGGLATLIVFTFVLLGTFLPSSARIIYDYNSWTKQDTICATSFAEQTKGWEWLFIDSRTKKSVSYPVEAEYYVYDSHPQYKVVGIQDDYNLLVYDENGKLLRVAYSGPTEFGRLSHFDSNAEVLDHLLWEASRFKHLEEARQKLLSIEEFKEIQDEDEYRYSSQDRHHNYYEAFKDNGLYRYYIDRRPITISFVDGSTYQKEFLELDYYGGVKYKNDKLNAIVNKINENNDLFSAEITSGESEDDKMIKFKQKVFDPDSSYIIRSLYETRSGSWRDYAEEVKGDMVLDAYKSNQYNIQSESQLVRKFVEKKIANLYFSGMFTTQQWLAVCKKHNLQFAYTDGLANQKLTPQQAFQKGLKERNLEESQQAERFIEQIKKDLKENYNAPLFERVDDLAFRIIFTNTKTGEKKCFIERYNSEKAFEYSSTIERE